MGHIVGLCLSWNSESQNNNFEDVNMVNGIVCFYDMLSAVSLFFSFYLRRGEILGRKPKTDLVI